MNILVTGGAGFIGSNIVDAYLEQGHEVSVVDDLSTGSLDNLTQRAKFFQIDIRDPQIEKIFRENKFDVVNHLAAQMDVRHSVADPMFDASVNIVGTLNVLENCVRSGVKRVIFSSTGGAVYGPQESFPADERHPTSPVSPYGVAKLSVEKYLYFYRETYGLKHVILRYANVYGPRQNPHGEAGVVAIFAGKMLKGEEVIINGDGKQTRDYVYVGDVVNANILATGYQETDVFNIGTGIETDVNTIFRKLKSATNAGVEEKHGPAMKGEQARSVVDYSKAKKALGWEPRVSLEQGLKLTVEFFRSKD